VELHVPIETHILAYIGCCIINFELSKFRQKKFKRL